MKKLLNFGVSDPLTLGMTHPIADRLETLGRARPTTWRSRVLALSTMGVLAIASAPLTIAADSHEEKTIRYVTSAAGEKTQSYEILTEDGVQRAYRLLGGGERESAKIETNEDGTIRLTFSNGQSVDLPRIDLAKLEGLKSLEGLQGLEGLAALEGLAGLEGLGGFSKSGVLDLSEVKIRSYNLEDSQRVVLIPPTIVDAKDADVKLKVLFEDDSNPLDSAMRQLELTKARLEALADDEALSFDLQNALRDLENAQKSLEAAGNRLEDAK